MVVDIVGKEIVPAEKVELTPFYNVGIASVQTSEVLPPAVIEELKTYIEEMRQVFDTETIWRTYTEATCSVLNTLKHPTNASKFHQAKKEQGVMFEQLCLLSFDYRERMLELKKIEALLVDATGFEFEELEIKRERLVYILDGMRRQAKDRMREVKMWSTIKKSIDTGDFDKDDKDTDELLSLALRYCMEVPQALRSQETAGSINIVGQAITLLTECRNRGIFDKLGTLGLNTEKLLGLR